MALLISAFQALAALPKLFEQLTSAIQGLQQAWEAQERAKFKAELSQVISSLEQNPNSEEKKELARDLQKLIARL